MNERVKFYQVGSWAAGNRLLGADDQSIQAASDRANTLTSGHRACQGCGEALGARYVLDTAMRVTGGQMVVVNATGCLEVFSTPYPESSWQVAWLHSLFGNAPAVASGVAAALRAKGDHETRVIAQAGDGGTVDIGMGCLSGMFERNDDVLFICYDNEAYMNAGVQRSAATPPAVRTATTPVASGVPGNRFGQGKDVPNIARAHRIRKMAGGGMRQSGLLAAAASHALDHHVERLAQDHALARRLGEGLEGIPGLTVEAPHSNIIFVDLSDALKPRMNELLAHLKSQNILATGLYRLRFVTHLDVDEAGVERAIVAIRQFFRA